MTYVSLEKITQPIIQKAGNKKYEVLSITAGAGFVTQKEKFGKEIAGEQYSKYIVVQKGDFSYNKGNSKTYPQGCVYCLEDYDIAAVPNVFYSFRFTSENTYPLYYKYVFESGFLNKQLNRLINSGVRDDGLLNLYEKDFYSCHVPCPPLEEQRRIAEILGCCDRVIALKKELIAEKKKQKKALMQKLLNPDSGFRRPGFSGEWKMVVLENICSFVGGGTPNTKIEDFWHGTIPWISSADVEEKSFVTNISRFITQTAVDSSATQLCPKGSLLIVSRVGVGKIAIAQEPLCTSQDFTNLTKIDGNVVFYAYLLKMILEERARQAQGTSIKGITVAEIKKLCFRVPSIFDEQQAIADILSAADKEIDLLEQELAQQEQKKKSLMQLLLTGIVRV